MIYRSTPLRRTPIRRVSLKPKRYPKPVPPKEKPGKLGDGEAMKAGTAEYKRRLEVMVIRQLRRCAVCLKRFAIVGPPQFDHEDGRGMNAAHRDDRIWNEDGSPRNAALCGCCNTKKGSRRYAWVDGSYQPKQ